MPAGKTSEYEINVNLHFPYISLAIRSNQKFRSLQVLTSFLIDLHQLTVKFIFFLIFFVLSKHGGVLHYLLYFYFIHKIEPLHEYFIP